MRVQVTQRAIKSGYSVVINIRHNGLIHRKLRHACGDGRYYTAGVYGWNADIYDIGGGIALVTGYRPFGVRLADDQVLEQYGERIDRYIAAFGI